MSSRRRNSRREKRSVAVAPIDQVARISRKRVQVERSGIGRGTRERPEKADRSNWKSTRSRAKRLALQIPRRGVGCKGEGRSLEGDGVGMMHGHATEGLVTPGGASPAPTMGNFGAISRRKISYASFRAQRLTPGGGRREPGVFFPPKSSAAFR